MQAVIQLLLNQPDLTVITATQRLSRRLLHEYNQYQLASGLTAWPTPDILSWSAWVQRQWQTLAIDTAQQQVVLTSAQSLQVWQAIIEADSDALINAQATAQKAQAARQQIIDYRLDLSDEAHRQWFVYDIDASKWLDWQQQYTQMLSDKKWLDGSAVTQKLIEQIINNQIDMTHSSCFAGFDEMTPLQQQLQVWMVEKGIWVSLPAEDKSAGNAALLTADNPAEEIVQAAHWARNQFENHWKDGDAPVGIIVPKLEQNRQHIERVLREVFYPEDGLSSLKAQPYHTQGIREDSVFNISPGVFPEAGARDCHGVKNLKPVPPYFQL